MKNYELVIIGGGSAGMAAALEANAIGITDILIIERASELGGVLLQCIHNGFGIQEFKEELSGPEYAQRFIDYLENKGITCLTNSMVLNIDSKKNITFSNEKNGLQVVKSKAIILATGCRERTIGSLAIPGTRPAGIWSAGTAQRYLNVEGMKIGHKAFILGSGDIGLIMARRMMLEGIEVLGVAEIMPYSKGLPRNISQCLNDFNIPLYLNHTITKIEGKKRLEAVTISRVDSSLRPIEETEKRIKCDTLLISAGLIPDNTLAEIAGITMNKVTKGALVNEFLQTSIDGVFSCGNGLHVHDIVDNVTSEARIAGYNAACYILGRQTEYKKSLNKINNVVRRSVEDSQDFLTCIVCPNGCKMKIVKNDFGREPLVLGNKCPKGREFAIEEIKNPKRVLTTTVGLRNAIQKRLPIKSTCAFSRAKLFEVKKALNSLKVVAPIKMGQIVAKDILGLGIDFVATRSIASIKSQP